MKRLFVVYNPRSSRYSDVKKDILGKTTDLKGCIIGKYEVEPTSIDENIAKFSKLLKDGDIVIAAGGDATGVIAANSILDSGKDATLAVLPYGNFNDLARTLGAIKFDDVRKAASITLHPLDIIIDTQHWRYATCYVTIGMTATAVSLYDNPSMRKKLKTNFGRKILSYTELASWYFKNRHKKQFLSEFTLNKTTQPLNVSDYFAVNGRFLARVMKGGEYYLDPRVFHSSTKRLTNFWHLFRFMTSSIFHRVPGTETTRDTLEFMHPATIAIQAEGESHTFKDVRQVTIKKSSQSLKVLSIYR